MKAFILAGFLLLGCVISNTAQPVPKPSSGTNSIGPTAIEPAFAPVTDDPKLPRILLVGDSISMGYTVPVRLLLRGKANVHRIPENGGPTTNGLAKLDQWLGGQSWDVIHFNFGLHDLRLAADGKRRVPPDEYEANLREIVRRLQGTRAKLIWATTTPVPPSIARQRRTEDVRVYNQIALKIMGENQVAIDDLYSSVLPQVSKIQRTNSVHYTIQGYEVLGKLVAGSIESALASEGKKQKN